MHTFIFIGYGNLAHSMMQGLSKHPTFSNGRFLIFGRNFQKAQDFASKFPNTQAIQSLDEVLLQNSIIVLCIKPKGIEDLFVPQSCFLLYSVMAGVKIQTLKEYFPQAQNITRAMPNIGASVQKSATSFFFHSTLENTTQTKEALSIAIKLTQSFGNATLLDHEDLIDSSIATNGSSPAFLSLVAEALIEAGVREGIPYAQSQELVHSTFEGFTKLLSSYSPQEIKTLVTSPGGTTAEGLAHLENKGFKGILQEAGHKAVLKARGKI